MRRTVYRDLDALMYAGFPVVSERRDAKVYYRFLDSFKLGDVPFTADEVLALAFGEDLLRTLEGTLFHDSIRSALAKIRAGLGEELSGLPRSPGRVVPGAAGPAQAIRRVPRHDPDPQRRRARATSRSRCATGPAAPARSRAASSTPTGSGTSSGGLYVIGHDHRSGEIRTFAVDRIRQIAETPNRFELPRELRLRSPTSRLQLRRDRRAGHPGAHPLPGRLGVATWASAAGTPARS